MEKKHYIVAKSKNGEFTFIDYSKMDGFKVTPRNEIISPGIEVNSLVIVKPIFIEKILKRKIRRKLEFYLKYIIDEASDEDSSNIHVLDNIERYRGIIEYKYRKYLDDKFINLLLKKIDLLEKQIKTKMLYQTIEQEEKKVEHKRRR